jgi:hypothetical protein
MWDGWRGFVAQVSPRSDFPVLQQDLSYGGRLGNATSGKSVEDRSEDLDLGNVPVDGGVSSFQGAPLRSLL